LAGPDDEGVVDVVVDGVDVDVDPAADANIRRDDEEVTPTVRSKNCLCINMFKTNQSPDKNLNVPNRSKLKEMANETCYITVAFIFF
jgi:hypothetical protein